MNSDQAVAKLTERKKASRSYLRSLSPEEKIAQLIKLQERYYEMLAAREANGGRPIPKKWLKWHTARHG